MKLARGRLPPGFSIERARLAQRIIASRVVERDEIEWPIRRAVGVDTAFTGGYSVGAAALVDYPGLKIVESAWTCMRTRMPYIPTLLAFREMAPAYLALKKIKGEYQVVFVDGNGRLHPYLAGFACQLGVTIGKPTIGVAKKLLIGEVGEWRNGWAPITYQGRIIGAAVETRPGCKPIYVSVGHKVTLETAIKIVRAFTKRYKLPEPIRQAHMAANRAKKMIGKDTCI